MEPRLVDALVSVPLDSLKSILSIAAIFAGLAVITSKNPVISVFNLISLYILVAFYLMLIGITYIAISYIIVYVGAIAILFLFIIMMIDVEVVPSSSRTRNTTPLMAFLFILFLSIFNQFTYYLGSIHYKNSSFYDIQKIYLELTNLDISLSLSKSGKNSIESNIEKHSIILEDSMESPILNYEEEDSKILINNEDEHNESLQENMDFTIQNDVINDNLIPSFENDIGKWDIINNTNINFNDTINKEILETPSDSFSLIYHSVIIPT